MVNCCTDFHFARYLERSVASVCVYMHESYLPPWFLQAFLLAVEEIVILHSLCCSCTSLPAAA